MLFRSRRSQSLGSGGNDIGLSFVNGTPIISDSVLSADKALRNSDLFSCVNLIASDVASAVFKMQEGNDPHLINLLQRRPNSLTNGFAFWQGTLANLLLNGNSYVMIYRSRDGMPVKLEFVPNYEVDVNITDNGQALFYKINFSDQRKPVVLPSSEVLHFKLMSKDGLMGISPLMSLVNEVRLQDASNRLTLNALTKSLNPSGILKVDKGFLNKKSKENIRNKFEQANSGDNAGRILVIDSTMTYTPKNLNADVLKVLQQVDWTRKQIAKVYGIPNNYLNQESEHSNQEQIQGLYSTCLNRYTNAITSEINVKLCRPNQSVMLDISHVVDPDNITLIKTLSDAVHWGLYTPEQAQQIIQEKGAA